MVKKDKEFEIEEAIPADQMLRRPRITTTQNVGADIGDLLEGLDEIEAQIETPLGIVPGEALVEVITNSTFSCFIGGTQYSFVKNKPQIVSENVRQVLEEANRLR